MVRVPTRGEYLLDLVLTDVGDMTKISVLPNLADHCVVCIDMTVVIGRPGGTLRDVWDFRRADWDRLKVAIKECRWGEMLNEAHFDESVDKFCNHLCELALRFVPKKTIMNHQNAHPWLDEECFVAIEAKCLATSRDDFLEKQRQCADVLCRKFKEYQEALKDRIRKLPSSSKLWWKYNRELLNRKSKNTTIPPLKAGDGSWRLSSIDKANLLADTFQGKCRLPLGEWRPEREERCHLAMSEFHLIRCRWASQIIKALDVDKACGPDLLPIRLFKECVKELLPSLAALTRFLLRCRRWPRRWRLHWVHPFYKKSSVSQPSNYRGIHLTSVISKIAERMIARILTPFLDRTGAYGMDQWAFRPKRSCRDLVALLVLRWIWALDNGFKIAIYLSDISGAFDKVDSEILVIRLRNTGASECLCDFIKDYLAPRSAVVLVQGVQSTPFFIDNQLFQGTVLGPPLWNTFFKSIDTPILEKAFRGAKFADDLTAYKNFESSTPNAEILDKLRDVQIHVHSWGHKHRVTFDAAKEHFCILHRADCCGEAFKLLGTLVDPKLIMEDEVNRIRRKCRPKIKAILATRYVYSVKDLVRQFKAHVWCILEASNIAIYHTSISHLESLDVLQTEFLRDIGLTEETAFLEHNMAPLKLRRDIGALGLLHKIQLGDAHPDFGNLFARKTCEFITNTRHGRRRHGKQFEEIAGNSLFFRRSLFGAVRVYNVLPECVVNASSVSTFQQLLTKDARSICQQGGTVWKNMYCCRHP